MIASDLLAKSFAGIRMATPMLRSDEVIACIDADDPIGQTIAVRLGLANRRGVCTVPISRTLATSIAEGLGVSVELCALAWAEPGARLLLVHSGGASPSTFTEAA